ncbi:hypothetical protein CG716_05170 [Mycolicibacterium sphagni]|uniref:Uncharacterized protein n=1 Tax=Mycolicibacterium sphagni TaxID=1786 RepID=A0A255DQW4_9MYCO|nr:hypothetical protein CG716_05170 [Mycolicibacterium sphagni]
MSQKFAVLAGSLERAKALFREFGWEQGHDRAFGRSKWGVDIRGQRFDLLLIDETALPLDGDTFAACRAAVCGGNAYVLRTVQPGDLVGR